MEPTLIIRKLIQAARKDAPSDAVPYAFDKRIMARILSRNISDHWAAWSAALWRAAAPCAGIALLLSAWTAFLPEAPGLANEEFAQHLENTVLAGANTEQSIE